MQLNHALELGLQALDEVLEAAIVDVVALDEDVGREVLHAHALAAEVVDLVLADLHVVGTLDPDRVVLDLVVAFDVTLEGEPFDDPVVMEDLEDATPAFISVALPDPGVTIER